MKKYLILCFCWLFGASAVIAQTKIPRLFQQTQKLKLVKKITLQMYNWEFEQAEANLAKYRIGMENHPSVPFVEGMILYWKHAPLDMYGTEYIKHETLIIKASELAETMLEENEDDTEAIFFKMATRSLLMKYYSEKGQAMKAVGEARGVYKLVKKGFDLKDELTEFYFTTGAYNYYREYYPEKHPVYKPFVWLFQSGDKALGLKQLQYATENATFTSAEAYAYLTYIYLRYEQDNEKALKYSSELAKKYPENLYFHGNYIETLLLTKKHIQVEAQCQKLLTYEDDIFYPTLGALYLGMVQEQYYKNLDEAYLYYSKVEANLDSLEGRFYYFKTYLYYGLSNYWNEKGNSEKAKEYYKKAKETDESGYLKQMEKPGFK